MICRLRLYILYDIKKNGNDTLNMNICNCFFSYVYQIYFCFKLLARQKKKNKDDFFGCGNLKRESVDSSP